MPLFTYRCTACENAFESLVRSGETPVCPSCGSEALEKQVARIAPEGKSKQFVQNARKVGAREGHFSNYSKSELKGKF